MPDLDLIKQDEQEGGTGAGGVPCRWISAGARTKNSSVRKIFVERAERRICDELSE
jgi:hypothetical protein